MKLLIIYTYTDTLSLIDINVTHCNVWIAVKMYGAPCMIELCCCVYEALLTEAKLYLAGYKTKVFLLDCSNKALVLGL